MTHLSRSKAWISIELWCFTHVSGGCIFQAAVGPACSSPYLHPFPERAFGEHRYHFLCPIYRWQPMPLCRKISLHQGHFQSQVESAKSHCIRGGTPEPRAEWPFHTVNSTKAQEVRNASFAWLVDGWFFLRTVLLPNNSLFPLPPLGSCPPSGHLTDAWSL